MRRGQAQLEYLILIAISISIAFIVLYSMLRATEFGTAQLLANLGMAEPAAEPQPNAPFLLFFYFGSLFFSIGTLIFSISRIIAARTRKSLKGTAQRAKDVFREE